VVGLAGEGSKVEPLKNLDKSFIITIEQTTEEEEVQIPLD